MTGAPLPPPYLSPGAPVITDETIYGTPPPPYRPEDPGVEARTWLTIALALVTALWLTAFALAQVTSREVAIPAAERSIAALSEVDSLVTLGERALCAQAGGDGALNLPGFVVGEVQVRANEMRCADGRVDLQAMRALLLSRGADLVYLRGIEAFIEAGRTPEPASPLSGAGAVRGLIDTLTATVHEPAVLAAWALGALGAMLAGALVLMGRGLGRLARVGVGLAVGATPVLLATLALRFALGRLATDDDPMLREFIAIAHALLGVPLWNAAWVLAGGLALVVPGMVAARR